MLILQRPRLDLVRRVGFEIRVETTSRIPFGFPVKLFGPATPSGRGRHWLAHDRSIELETWRISRQETGYRALYRRLTRPRDGHVVEHSSFRNDHFIVSGRQDGRDFYLRVIKTPRDSRGFSLFWNPKHAVFMDRVAVAMSSSMTGIMEQEESRPNDTMNTPDQMSPPPENEDLNAAVPPPGTVTSRSTGSGTGS